MTLEQAKSKILDLWRAEKKNLQYDSYVSFFQSARAFYDNLKSNNAELLSFSCLGDRWQVVNRWLHVHEGYMSP